MTTYYVAKYTPTLAYCFDGTVSDPDTAWTNDANIADCDTATVASTSTTGGSTSNYIQIVGNAAPTSGGTITDVWVRAYVSDSSDTTGGYEVRTSGWGESLSTGSFGLVTSGHPSDWHFWKKLTTPTGGWTWQKISDLEIRVWISIAGTFYIAQVQVGVNIGLSKENPYYHMTDAEDTPVAANDTVYVGPGLYAEQFICDVSGSSGQPITYIGDVTGENTDGVGGVVLMSGLNYSTGQSLYITEGIDANNQDYRTFRGLTSHNYSSLSVNLASAIQGWVLEDCVFAHSETYDVLAPSSAGGVTDLTIRRCLFFDYGSALTIIHSATVDNANILIENCLFIGGFYGVRTDRHGGVTIKNCSFIAQRFNSILMTASPSAGQTVTVNNCIFIANTTALSAPESDDITEDYNTFFGNATDRSVVATGTNSVTYPMYLRPTILLDGYKFPSHYFEVDPDSAIAQITGSSPASDDFYGVTRPTTASKITWGPIQADLAERDTTTTRGSSTASLVSPDANRTQFVIPVTAVSTTISVYVHREANYAGTLPQMVIKEPGQSDRTTTDTGSASQYNQLTDTFTPQSTTNFVVVELVSNNTATSGSYAVYFDDLSVV